MEQVNFSASKEDAEIITKIMQRAAEMLESTGRRVDRLSLHMDITATHLNGTPLRLAELLDAPGFDFMHDVSGIMRHIDRTTGKLTGCFLPRFAKHE